MNSETHRTHCCIIHGCKYHDENCPVTSGEIEQEYPCEDCNDPYHGSPDHFMSCNITKHENSPEWFVFRISGKHPVATVQYAYGKWVAEIHISSGSAWDHTFDTKWKAFKWVYEQFR